MLQPMLREYANRATFKPKSCAKASIAQVFIGAGRREVALKLLSIATGNEERLSSDPGRIIGGEINHSRCDIRRKSDATEWSL